MNLVSTTPLWQPLLRLLSKLSIGEINFDSVLTLVMSVDRCQSLNRDCGGHYNNKFIH